MRAAQPEDFHSTRIAMKYKAAVNGHRWQSDLSILKFDVRYGACTGWMIGVSFCHWPLP